MPGNPRYGLPVESLTYNRHIFIVQLVDSQEKCFDTHSLTLCEGIKRLSHHVDASKFFNNIRSIIHYKPKYSVTCYKFSRLFSSYISLGESDFHLPYILRSLSGIELLLLRTADIMPPDLKVSLEISLQVV